MPSRILKESIQKSPSLAELSDAAERLWHRLVTVVDDFGRFDGEAEVILSVCFSRRPKGWTRAKVVSALGELANPCAVDGLPLIFLYASAGRTYLQVTKAREHIHQRAKASKYPAPPAGIVPRASASICTQAQANVALNESENENGNESENGRRVSCSTRRMVRMGEACPEEVRELLGLK